MENYQKKLEEYIAALKEKGERPRLLLHSCCAPCSSYVLWYLNGIFDITLLFYNPNMDTEAEYHKRASELLRLVDRMGLSERVKTEILPYDHEAFLSAARGLETCPERGERCLKCYRLRLKRTAEYLKEHSDLYDMFATTLTLSPLKNAAALNETGLSLSEELSVKYLPTDFKKNNGYKRSIELSKIYELYRQNYCGCQYSKRGNENE